METAVNVSCMCCNKITCCILMPCFVWFFAIFSTVHSYHLGSCVRHFWDLLKEATSSAFIHTLFFLLLLHFAIIRMRLRSYVTQGPKTRHLSGIIYRDTSKNRREGFSSLKFFISACVRKIVIIWKVVTRFQCGLFYLTQNEALYCPE